VKITPVSLCIRGVFNRGVFTPCFSVQKIQQGHARWRPGHQHPPPRDPAGTPAALIEALGKSQLRTFQIDRGLSGGLEIGAHVASQLIGAHADLTACVIAFDQQKHPGLDLVFAHGRELAATHCRPEPIKEGLSLFAHTSA
jgi:hypothetical protein